MAAFVKIWMDILQVLGFLLSPFHCVSDDLCHVAHALVVGMYTIVLHIARVSSEERVEVDDLQTVLTRHFLLDGYDTIGNDRVINVPR